MLDFKKWAKYLSPKEVESSSVLSAENIAKMVKASFGHDLLTDGFEEINKFFRPTQKLLDPYNDFASASQLGGWTSYKFHYTYSMPPRLNFKYFNADETKKEPATFEVNLMEPLVGWKSWKIKNEFLFSPSYGTVWKPDEALVATCGGSSGLFNEPHEPHTEDCPQDGHSCGIYAADKRKETTSYEGDVYGLVYGWGRYIRGDQGWRAQFAYPRSFYLRPEQVDLIPVLAKYHVPILVETPTLVYKPEEDGYTNEYRNAEANWNSGTAPEPGPDEDFDSYDEED